MKSKSIEIINLLYGNTGEKLSDEDINVLSQEIEPNSLPANFNEIVGRAYNACTDGLLISACKGYEFEDPSIIKDHFGMSLEENYPNANKLFLDFAKTYWSYKLAISEQIPEEEIKLYANALLKKLELNFASIFFPTPGLLFVRKKKRQKAQRDILDVLNKQYDLNYNVDEFIKGNPYLG